MHRKLLSVLAGCLLLLRSAMAAAGSVYLEDMTTTELAAALREGHTTIIIPVGGTEQSGPHMALGKHNVRVHVLAGRIAQQLGNAVVAPVVAYVPEGAITPPTEHMRFAGTISIPEATFKALLEAAARSLRQHGFKDVVLLGDHGGYQNALRSVAIALNREWASSKSRAHFVGEYYQATQTSYVRALKAKGLSDAQIGIHAGSADTSLMMAIDPSLVRPELFAQAAAEGRSDGTNGDPRASSAALGQLGVDAVVQQSVSAIRKAVGAAR
ncbi:MAG: creatininase family protein [Burkholderiaceae bacterium]